MFTSRYLRALFAALLLVLGLTVGFAGVASAEPPGIPSAATARSELTQLRVAPDGSMTGYSRDLFPHWITISGACNTRETVLKRDGTNVVTNSSCAATSGRWFSPFDGATWTLASDVDIDHIVSAPATDFGQVSAGQAVSSIPVTAGLITFDTPGSTGDGAA